MKSRLTLTVAASTLAVLAPVVAVVGQHGASAAVAPSAAATSPTVPPTPTVTTPVPTETATTPVPTETTPTEAVEPGGWSPKSGVRFNEPRRAKKSHVINSYIRKAIMNSKKGSQIRLVTWNFSSGLFMSDVINAHKRGVSVRIIMANGLARNQGANGYYGRTKAALEKGNKKRDKNMTSWFQTCKNSCRGIEGIQHGKWFMFSKTGGRDKVIMSTSANLTDAAAYNQWNDLLTIVGQEETWNQYVRMFNQMSKDKPRKRAFYTFTDGRYQGWFFPNMGRTRNYNVVKMLDKVRCKGARGDAGKNGYTVIRVSQAVFNGKPGSAVSGKLKALHKRGCKIRMVYGVLNDMSRKNLEGIPSKTILEDVNGDQYVDRYIHMKALTISGVYDGKRASHIVYQGSANWSGMSTLSDEQGFIIRSRELEAKYSKFIEKLYKNPPPQGQNLVKEINLRQKQGFDPFALVREEMGMGNMTPSFD